jgi:hypothetical protein
MKLAGCVVVALSPDRRPDRRPIVMAGLDPAMTIGPTMGRRSGHRTCFLSAQRSNLPPVEARGHCRTASRLALPRGLPPHAALGKLEEHSWPGQPR